MKITTLEVGGYEKVVRADDPRSGLKAFIAVHDTTLGPALGGMRIWPYATEKEAQTDVLRLAAGMTYKSAVAETGLGGGKSVIMADPRTQKTPTLLRAMGRFINELGGLYITAEDVGSSTDDMLVVAEETKWVTGLPRDRGGSGDPSPFTALGVFIGLKAALETVTRSDNFAGKTVAVQGLGHVGYWLCKHLSEAGARLYVADVRPERVERAKKEFAAIAVQTEEIYDAPCDIFAPCALGAILNDQTLPRLRCRIVGGAANNQLQEERHSELLQGRGILYAPDYVINAGGIINVGLELAPGGYDESESLARVRKIGPVLKEVFAIASASKISTDKAAKEIALRKLRDGRQRRLAARDKATPQPRAN
ncbi:MAG: Glu/Leu/Phe/Val dehydrogenase dimerization domain-containing protein [Planctomycetota bacterium]